MKNMTIQEYLCHRADQAPCIDGHLDEVWQAAVPVCLVENCTGQAPRQSTSVRMMWDDQALYVAFVCEDNDIWGDMIERDAPLFEQQVVEVFLDANSDGISYVELEVSPLNTVLDLLMLNRNEHRKGLWEWNCDGLQTAVKVEGDASRRGSDDVRWTVEVAIPFAEMLMAPSIPPQVGDAWHVNLYRIDRPYYGDWELSAWSPTWREDFHVPEVFGRLVFVE